MRRISMIVATVAAMFAVVGVAVAALDVTQGLAVKTTGSKGTKKKPKAIKLDVTTTTKGNGETKDGTYVTQSAIIHLDKNLKFNPSKFPTCTPDRVAAEPDPSKPVDCPKGSLIGKGSADATVGEGQLKVHPTITAYNGAGSTLILQLTKAAGEIDSTGQLVGKLQSDSGKYGKKLNVPIPSRLQNQLGLSITLTRFNTVISAKAKKGGKTVNYIESVGCTGGKYNFGGDFILAEDTVKTTPPENPTVYEEKTNKSVTTTAKC